MVMIVIYCLTKNLLLDPYLRHEILVLFQTNYDKVIPVYWWESIYHNYYERVLAQLLIAIKQ